jgi:hypothetical protein
MHAKGGVLLGTVVIKRLQMLVWWVQDHQKHDLPFMAAEFNATVMNQASKMKALKQELSDKDPRQLLTWVSWTLMILMHMKTHF